MLTNENLLLFKACKFIQNIYRHLSELENKPSKCCWVPKLKPHLPHDLKPSRGPLNGDRVEGDLS